MEGEKSMVGKDILRGIRTRYIVVVLAALLIVFLGLYTFRAEPLEIKILDVRFSVSDNPGFDLNKESLTFGRIVPGGSGMRKVNLDNNYNFSVKVKLDVSDEIRKFLVAENPIYLKSGENKSVPFNVFISNYTEHGDYSGILRFSFYKD